MKLDELIEYLDYKDLINFKNIDITGISYNSKTTKKGDIFVCLVGEHTDGHDLRPVLHRCQHLRHPDAGRRQSDRL